MPDLERVVSDADMPQLFLAADRASLDAQAAYLGRTRLRLLLLVAAGSAGVVSLQVGKGDVDVGALLGLGFFALALAVEATLWRDRPDKAWYDGRALAESAKTLAWKFAVGGDPFPVAKPMPEATALLQMRLDDLGHQFRELELDAVDAPMVTAWMTLERGAPFDERRATYLRARLHGQKAWYAAKSAYNRRRARQWRTTLICLELGGAALSLVEAVFRPNLLLPPILAAVAGAVVAWLETKQHDSLGRAYSAAVRDLASAETRLGLVDSEEAWAVEVADAEEAISREHTVWLASRSA